MAIQSQKTGIENREESQLEKDRREADRSRRMADFELGNHRDSSIREPESLPDAYIFTFVWPLDGSVVPR